MRTNPDLTGATWRKSSYSGDTGGECVEVADHNPHIAIRDSKNPAAGVLTITPHAFATFVKTAVDDLLS
ncbi:DUF397 domain-containing protein [Streptomyces sp. NPDC002573]|uniref:DUF397 domain-containing protein n=1 Tax=Streptomyces sp. NPDC002573 TaxID=3364651 RepID=UPI00368FE22F